jgi:hypothetical protein
MFTTSCMNSHTSPPRIERKYFFENLHQAQQVITRCHRHGFRQAYPARQVNSLYFDTPQRQMYHDSINGLSPRHKIRLRWYGPSQQKSPRLQLEIKHKYGEVGDKTTYLLPAKVSLTNHAQLITHLKKLLSQKLQTQYPNLAPSLTTIYQRQYYSFNEIRLTCDTNLQPLPHHLSPQATVLELKFSPTDASQLGQISQLFPRSWQRFSKYTDLN